MDNKRENIEEEVLALLSKLICLPSITPEDAGCQDLISNYLSVLGFKIEHMHYAEVKNIWARYDGTNKGPLLCFAGHTDVVPAGLLEQWSSLPFTPTVRDGYLYGRGAADMKGSITAMLVAVKNFLSRKNHLKGSIAFLLTSDEEGPAVNGTKKVIETLEERKEKIDHCIVGEPSSTNTVGDTIKNGRRGSITAKLEINGIQGHVAYPHLADNALHKSLGFLKELTEHVWDEGFEKFPGTSLQITSLDVDNKTSNVIPGKISLQFNLRFNPKQSPEKIKQAVANIMSAHNLTNCSTISWNVSGLPFYSPKNELTEAAVQAIKEVKNITPILSTSGGTSDGRFIAPTGASVIELGPINKTIHQINECIKIEELVELTRIYEKLLTNYFK